MAQAARPLESAPPRPPRLRAVAPPPRRRPPSRQVIRRRRLVALAGLLTGAVGIPLAVVALAGGPASEADRIRDLLTAGSANPKTLCDHLSSGMSAAIGGRDACVAASPERGPAASVRDVDVDGSSATATVVSDNGSERVRLVAEGGDWKVDDVR